VSIGITTYGAYIPRYRITVEEIARVWGDNANDIKKGLRVLEKSVPDRDEDTATIAVEAARSALRRSGLAEPTSELYTSAANLTLTRSSRRRRLSRSDQGDAGADGC